MASSFRFHPQRSYSVCLHVSRPWLMSFRDGNRTAVNMFKFGINSGRKDLASCFSTGVFRHFQEIQHFTGFSHAEQQQTELAGLHASLLGPSVRHLLESYGLQTHAIQPSGHKGQLLKGDVLKYIHENAKIQINFTAQSRTEEMSHSETLAPVLEVNSEYTDIGLSNERAMIAKRVAESKKSIPHTYSTVDCNMENIFILCKKLKEMDIEVSINDFVIKAASLALCRIPEVNSYWSGNGPVLLNDVNIAVTLASPNGLVTPVINNANELNVQNISSAVRELSSCAKKGQLQIHDLVGGSFTISNLGGMFGIKHFTAVITPPQTAILAVGQPHVCLNESTQEVTKVMIVTLCCDGRIVDERLASTWLNEFQNFIENPVQMGL